MLGTTVCQSLLWLFSSSFCICRVKEFLSTCFNMFYVCLFFEWDYKPGFGGKICISRNWNLILQQLLLHFLHLGRHDVWLYLWESSLDLETEPVLSVTCSSKDYASKEIAVIFYADATQLSMKAKCSSSHVSQTFSICLLLFVFVDYVHGYVIKVVLLKFI